VIPGNGEIGDVDPWPRGAAPTRHGAAVTVVSDRALTEMAPPR
jgi:hypothetical protein